MRGFVCGLMVVGLLVGTARGAAYAAQPQPAAASVGIVDLARLDAGYRSLRQMKTEFEAFKQQQDAKLQVRVKTRLLDDAEQQEYLDLGALGAPTETNRKRVEYLASLSDAREQQLADLGKKQNRTAEEQKDYATLDKIRRARLAESTKLQGDLEQMTLTKRGELMKVIDDNLHAAVRAVADQRKLSTVLAKEAVLFGGVDITDEVLVRLNAGKAAS